MLHVLAAHGYHQESLGASLELIDGLWVVLEYRQVQFVVNAKSLVPVEVNA